MVLFNPLRVTPGVDFSYLYMYMQHKCFRKCSVWKSHCWRCSSQLKLFSSYSISVNTNIQAQVVQIHIHQLIIIYTIYLPPIFFNSMTSIIWLYNYSPLLPFLVILMHITLFGKSPEINHCGQIIEDFVMGNCFAW